MMKIIIFNLFIVMSFVGYGQESDIDLSVSDRDSLPYYQIPDAPGSFTAANTVARAIDGLGFRYYWATEDLREADLAFTPGNNGKNAKDVLDHILGLSYMILNAVKNQPNERVDRLDWQWNRIRKQTLLNIEEVSTILKTNDVDFEKMNIIFKRGDQTTEFPFWNVLNGPMADAIYHTGQIVSFRRSAGNPIHPNVSVLRGKVRE